MESPTIRPESIPPLKKAPTGTSACNLLSIALDSRLFTVLDGVDNSFFEAILPCLFLNKSIYFF